MVRINSTYMSGLHLGFLSRWGGGGLSIVLLNATLHVHHKSLLIMFVFHLENSYSASRLTNSLFILVVIGKRKYQKFSNYCIN
jgi:uncharacterized membrane protein YphA (DoxX/SURF4 family)